MQWGYYSSTPHPTLPSLNWIGQDHHRHRQHHHHRQHQALPTLNLIGHGHNRSHHDDY